MVRPQNAGWPLTPSDLVENFETAATLVAAVFVWKRIGSLSDYDMHNSDHPVVLR